MSEAVETETRVLTELRGDVYVVTLNDPRRKNAVGAQMRKELAEAFATPPASARAVYLTGAENSFCAGANLTEDAGEMLAPDRDLGRVLDRDYHPIFEAMRALNMPLIVGVNGPAVGIGLSFAQMGDLIIIADSAYFSLGFGKIGLAPDGGATWILPRAMGRTKAMRFYMENNRVTGREALDWNLATHALPDAGFQEAAFEIANAAAAGPTRAIALVRQAFWDSFDNSYRAQLDREVAIQTEAGRTQDFMEGVTAFMDKRPARFSGS